MSLIDVLIPGIVGVVVFLWPRAMFFGSRVSPTEQKVRWLKYLGLFLVLVAAFNLLVKFLGK